MQNNINTNFKKSPLHIMECHVQGYTMQCPYIPEHKRGKFLGLCDPFMIDHLKKLGVNTVQIMPIMKKNNTYWGYDSVAWCQHEESYGTESELRTMVKTLQDNGFKVILDVVFNHSSKPIEGVQYYDWNVTGCENTVDVRNSLHIIKRAMDYWLRDIGVDGFRYDLAGVLGREGGEFKKDAAFFKLVHRIYSDKIHIAEPYDIAAMNLGMFPESWYELNHHVRDTIRSGFTYNGTTALSEARSIGFVTVHDGMTLRDTTEYNNKHNWMNMEGNRDGANDNKSCNHGVEGPSDNPCIIEAREKHKFGMIRNLRENCYNWLILQGDELNNSQGGCNNGYLFGNQITWVDWSQYETEFHKTLEKLGLV